MHRCAWIFFENMQALIIAESRHTLDFCGTERLEAAVTKDHKKLKEGEEDVSI